MKIVNISSMLLQMAPMHRVIMVTVLPILFKHRNIPQKRLDEQRHTNIDVLPMDCGRFSSLSPLNKILVPKAGITQVSAQMATSAIAKRFK
jgi:hypothetical protein